MPKMYTLSSRQQKIVCVGPDSVLKGVSLIGSKKTGCKTCKIPVKTFD